MNRSPAFQFYPQDWLASAKVAEMTLEEEGAYIRLICYCWMTGSIPADPARCAKMVGKGCTVEVATAVQLAFNQISTTLQPNVNQTSTSDQRMTHERLEKEREKQDRHREKSAFGGRQSAKSRSAKSMTETSKNHPSTTLQPNVNLSSSTSVEDECVLNRKKSGVPSRKEVEEYVREHAPQICAQEFYDFYESKNWMVGKNKMKQWKSAVATWRHRAAKLQKKPRLPDYNTPEGMAELKSAFLAGDAP